MTALKKTLLRPAFVTNEGGAVTVDWIVLTAGLVALGLGAAFYITSSVPQLADRTSDFMRDYDLETPITRDDG